MKQKTTKLKTYDKLPLTCLRTGTCCYGKIVQLNAWELQCLARAKNITPREFRDKYCEFGGIRLQFNGEVNWHGQHACSQYNKNIGCSVHLGRPLACRLYPLGRQIQNNKVHYMYQGNKSGCPEVAKLPFMTVGEYLRGQITSKFEDAQDAYLDLMQNIADMAFIFLLDTGLAKLGDTKTLAMWRIMGNEQPEDLANRIGHEWIDYLMLPDINNDLDDPILFANTHNKIIQLKAHQEFGGIGSNSQFHQASVLLMGVALLLAQGIGADAKILAEHWIEIAKENGALE